MPVRKVKGGYKIPHVHKVYKTQREAKHVAQMREIHKHMKDNK